MKVSSCPICGMSKSEWTENEGSGVDYLGETYCCEGCAKGTGCTCSEIREKTARIIRRDSSEF
jgi:hypothetical protein